MFYSQQKQRLVINWTIKLIVFILSWSCFSINKKSVTRIRLKRCLIQSNLNKTKKETKQDNAKANQTKPNKSKLNKINPLYIKTLAFTLPKKSLLNIWWTLWQLNIIIWNQKYWNCNCAWAPQKWGKRKIIGQKFPQYMKNKVSPDL